jgi:hypothetical protein
MTQLVERLPRKCETLSTTPSIAKKKKKKLNQVPVVHACNPS